MCNAHAGISRDFRGSAFARARMTTAPNPTKPFIGFTGALSGNTVSRQRALGDAEMNRAARP